MADRKPASNLDSLMQNPYQPPSAPISSTAEDLGNTRENGLFIAGLACALVAAILPMLAIPAFRQVFAAFGADLPLLTIAVLRYHLVAWLLPLLVLAARLFWPRAGQRATIACRLGVAGMLLVLLVSAIAMYLPIFQLGAVV